MLPLKITKYMNLKKILLIVTVITISSCVAQRCPEQACHVLYEHTHEGGIYRGVNYLKATKHWPWSKDKPIAKKKSKTEKKKKGWGRLFDWERE
jgi:hypothetical protein